MSELVEHRCDQVQVHAADQRVVIEAEHLCSTITSTLLGSLREDPRSRAEFLALTISAPATAGGRPG